MEFRKADRKKYLECAAVINTHGVAGGVKLECRADSPEVLAKLKRMYVCRDGGYLPLKVKRASVFKDMVIAFFEEVDTMEKAIAMKKNVLYADRGDFRLAPGDFFIADIIGLPVFDNGSGEEIGRLAEVLSPVGRQVYVIEKKNGKSFMVPAVPDFIKKVSFGEDCDAGVYVELIEGMDDTL